MRLKNKSSNYDIRVSARIDIRLNSIIEKKMKKYQRSKSYVIRKLLEKGIAHEGRSKRYLRGSAHNN